MLYVEILLLSITYFLYFIAAAFHRLKTRSHAGPLRTTVDCLIARFRVISCNLLSARLSPLSRTFQR